VIVKLAVAISLLGTSVFVAIALSVTPPLPVSLNGPVKTLELVVGLLPSAV
jgi:hypothetical protein